MGTISKALDLLTFFGPNRGALGLSDFVRLTGRDKATVHRHLTELEENGFLEQHPETRAYRLGPALLRLAAVREAAFPMRKLLRPIVTELAETVGELAHASLLQGDVLSPVAHADPARHGTQVHFDLSEVLPLHATASGLAVLAFGPERLRARVLGGPLPKTTPQTITQPGNLARLLAQVRAQGYARITGTYDAEVASQGVALWGAGGQVIGGLSVAIPLTRARPALQDQILEPLLAAARTASLSLGAQPADLSPAAPTEA